MLVCAYIADSFAYAGFAVTLMQQQGCTLEFSVERPVAVTRRGRVGQEILSRLFCIMHKPSPLVPKQPLQQDLQFAADPMT